MYDYRFLQVSGIRKGENNKMAFLRLGIYAIVHAEHLPTTGPHLLQSFKKAVKVEMFLQKKMWNTF